MGCKMYNISPGDLSSITRTMRTFFHRPEWRSASLDGQDRTHQHNQPISLSARMRLLWRLISSITTTLTGQPISGHHQLCRNKTIMARLK